MTAAELYKELKNLIDDGYGSSEVYFNYTDGCNECNAEWFPDYKEVTSIQWRPTAEYPHSLEDIVVMR